MQFYVKFDSGINKTKCQNKYQNTSTKQDREEEHEPNLVSRKDYLPYFKSNLPYMKSGHHMHKIDAKNYNASLKHILS